jgi:hypothetical protein
MQARARLAVAVAFACATAAGASSAAAQDNDKARARVHEGFFLRASAGLGYSVIGANREDDVLTTVSGLATHWNFAVGGSVIPRLALHAVYWGASAFVTKTRIDGHAVHDDDLDEVATIHNWGAGLTYYNPSNWYAGAQFGVAMGVTTNFDTGRAHTSSAGFGFGGIVGKEWFVAPQLGIGVGGQFNLAILPDHGDRWMGISFGPLFSLTLN